MARRFGGRLAVIITIIATYMGFSTRCFAGCGGKLQRRYLPHTAAASVASRRAVSVLADPSPDEHQRALAQVERAVESAVEGSTKLASKKVRGSWILRVSHLVTLAIDGKLIATLDDELSFNLRAGIYAGGSWNLTEKLHFVNTWNNRNRFTNAYVEDDGCVKLDYYLDLTAIDEAESAILQAIRIFAHSLEIGERCDSASRRAMDFRKQQHALQQVEKAVQLRAEGSTNFAAKQLSKPTSTDGEVLGRWALTHRETLGTNVSISAALEHELTFKLHARFEDVGRRMSLAEKLQFVNKWNNEQKFTKAYMDEDGYVMLQYALDLTAIDEAQLQSATTQAIRVFDNSEEFIRMTLIASNPDNPITRIFSEASRGRKP